MVTMRCLAPSRAAWPADGGAHSKRLRGPRRRGQSWSSEGTIGPSRASGEPTAALKRGSIGPDFE